MVFTPIRSTGDMLIDRKELVQWIGLIASAFSRWSPTAAALQRRPVKLGIAPVAATRAVAALEKELGVLLLRRTTRSVGLTQQGADYLARSRRALAELDDAARAVRDEDAHPRGQLAVTAPVLFGRMYVMPIVAGLLSDHPQLSIRVILVDRVRAAGGGGRRRCGPHCSSSRQRPARRAPSDSAARVGGQSGLSRPARRAGGDRGFGRPRLNPFRHCDLK